MSATELPGRLVGGARDHAALSLPKIALPENSSFSMVKCPEQRQGGQGATTYSANALDGSKTKLRGRVNSKLQLVVGTLSHQTGFVRCDSAAQCGAHGGEHNEDNSDIRTAAGCGPPPSTRHNGYLMPLMFSSATMPHERGNGFGGPEGCSCQSHHWAKDMDSKSNIHLGNYTYPRKCTSSDCPHQAIDPTHSQLHHKGSRHSKLKSGAENGNEAGNGFEAGCANANSEWLPARTGSFDDHGEKVARQLPYPSLRGLGITDADINAVCDELCPDFTQEPVKDMDGSGLQADINIDDLPTLKSIPIDWGRPTCSSNGAPERLNPDDSEAEATPQKRPAWPIDVEMDSKGRLEPTTPVWARPLLSMYAKLRSGSRHGSKPTAYVSLPEAAIPACGKV